MKRRRCRSLLLPVSSAVACLMIGCRTSTERLAAADAAPAPWLWGSLTRGPYAVGLEVSAAGDSARPERLADGPAAPRPLEMVVWHPSPRGALTREHVRFATYVDLSDGSMTAPVSARSDDDRRRWLAAAMSREPASIAPAMLDSVLATRMVAIRGAPPVAERLPAVLWSTRHATPAAQSVLSEYLASHGYVVAWMRYAGTDTLRPPFDDVTPARKAATLEAHVADMQWALRWLALHASVDSTRMGVAAWSYSGEPATVLAQRTPRLRVLVSLSSNILVSTYRGIDMAASMDTVPLRAGVIMQIGRASCRERV